MSWHKIYEVRPKDHIRLNRQWVDQAELGRGKMVKNPSCALVNLN